MRIDENEFTLNFTVNKVFETEVNRKLYSRLTASRIKTLKIEINEQLNFRETPPWRKIYSKSSRERRTPVSLNSIAVRESIEKRGKRKKSESRSVVRAVTSCPPGTRVFIYFAQKLCASNVVDVTKPVPFIVAITVTMCAIFYVVALLLICGLILYAVLSVYHLAWALKRAEELIDRLIGQRPWTRKEESRSRETSRSVFESSSRVPSSPAARDFRSPRCDTRNARPSLRRGNFCLDRGHTLKVTATESRYARGFIVHVGKRSVRRIMIQLKDIQRGPVWKITRDANKRDSL